MELRVNEFHVLESSIELLDGKAEKRLSYFIEMLFLVDP